MGKIILAIIGICLVFIMMPMVITALNTMQVDEYSQVEAGIATGVGDDDATVTLDFELWNDSIAEVESISSNISGDGSAAADSYVSGTQVLTIDGLAASENRTLTVTFNTDALSDYSGLSELARFAPTIIVVALISAALFGVYKMFG